MAQSTAIHATTALCRALGVQDPQSMTPYLLKVFGTGQGSRTLDSFEAAWPQIQAALLAAGVPAGTAAGWQRKVRASRNANTVASVLHAILLAKRTTGVITLPAKATTARAPAPPSSARAAASTMASAAGACGQPSSLLSGQVISEAQLVRDMLYVFQGIDGDIVRWRPDIRAYDAPDNVPPAARALIRRLGELGWTYSHIQQSIAAIDNTDLSNGVVMAALVGAVRVELRAYFELLAALEQDAVGPDGLVTTSTVTLRRLVAWYPTPLAHLQLLARALDSTLGLRGGAVVHHVATLAITGVQEQAALMARVLQRTLRPWLGMVREWIADGTVRDEADEFFVNVRPDVELENAWKHGFELRPHLLPGFVDAQFALRVLLLGKTVHFIRSACSDAAWVVATRAQRLALPSPVSDSAVSHTLTHQQVALRERKAGLRAMGAAALVAVDEAVVAALPAANARVMELLMDKAALPMHLRAVKRYLLLGQGDFVTSLIESITPHLSKPAALVATSTNTLLDVLDRAVMSTNAALELPDALGKLHIKLHRAQTGQTGWDTFTLTYLVEPPLNAIITPSSMAAYHAIFRFLWFLKRAEHVLSRTWSVHATASHILMKYADLRNLLHRAHLLRNEMLSFVTALSNYVMFEVLETAWDKLMSELGLARSADEARAGKTAGRAAPGSAQPDSTRSSAQASTGMGYAEMWAEAEAEQWGDGVAHEDADSAAGQAVWSGAAGRTHASSSKAKKQVAMDLDAVIAAHERYLRRIMSRAAIQGRSAELRKYLHSLLSTCLDFAELQEAVYAEALQAVQMADDLGPAASLSTLVGLYGPRIEELREEYRYVRSGQCGARIAGLQTAAIALASHASARYTSRQGMVSLLERLEVGGEELEAFRFLLLRFDFNGYYRGL